MSSDDVAGFYGELRSAITALDDASSTPDSHRDGARLEREPCGDLDDIFVSYQTVITINGVEVPRPECSGVVQMPGQGTTQLSCTIAVPAGAQIGRSFTARPVLGRPRADAIVATVDANAKKSQAKANCPLPSIHATNSDKPGC
ncbi:hypothetical protein [Nocardia seriolae]|uniref:Uncharacterized protein n=1 Tax=Nocardia seriolae TaxID=37332 RepID=A0A0B8NDK1_9NOCA|nr:hypothetical protein [Nocardia seriolae]APA99778.1 hypothetical protein NS506_05735 [Nocardia seriolae]MTJ62632.1 hypothetical protein [Nocardia seriolae]MTJ75420.1 hypothetical protein [Nocardia seriolae]MTJ89328.1 hypothetical protein [Nocardia seriolae]MTK33305.1 hypothetical protein [Nocardia seriolae]